MKFSKSKKTHRRRSVRRNPSPIHRRRASHRRRSVRRNPSAGAVEFLTTAGLAGAGALAGVVVRNVAARYVPAKAAPLVTIAAAVGLASFVRGEGARAAAIGAGAVGVLDLVRSFLPAGGILAADLPEYPEYIPQVYGDVTAALPMGYDEAADLLQEDDGGLYEMDETDSVPLGADEAGESLYAEDDIFAD